MFAVGLVLLFTLYTSFAIVISKSSFLLKLVALVTFVAGLVLLLQRDTFLPFLGRMALPPTVLKDAVYPPHSNSEVDLSFNVPDGTKVVYWGAKPSNTVVPNPWDAYGDFTNAGVAIVVGGRATLRFACPSKYQVGSFRRTLNRHIHYRICDERGMIGSVQTRFVKC